MYSFQKSFPFIFLLAVPFSKLSTLSSVISPPSTPVFSPSFLALVIILSVSLNLFLLAFTHFGSFNSSGYSSGKTLYFKN